MAPKKKEQKKVMSLGDFLADEKTGGSWADEMEDYPTTDSRTSFGASQRTYNSSSNTYGTGNTGGYSVREELPLPDKPPFTVHLGNLSFDATNGDVQDFFTGCECINVRIIEDKMENKPKGFGYAEFGTLEGLKKALTLNGTQFQGRNIRISVADPPKDRGDGSSFRQIDDWSRKGPLPDLPGRGGSERRGGFGGDFGGGERRQRDFPEGDGKVRDFGNWERKGPLSPAPQAERAPREGGRPRGDEGQRNESFRDRTPAQWGEGRPQGSQDGSRPPRKEFQERPPPAPTAAEQDSQWRTKMRPDAPPPAAQSSHASREGSEAPSSPAPGATPTLASRPKLNLAKRTVTEQDVTASAASGDAKASPFGAARPIDTAAKEREIEEKKLAAAKEKKEADEKAKAERDAEREAAKVAKAAEDEAAKDAEGEKKVEILKKEEGEESTEAATGETIETENANGQIVDDKAVKPKEVVRDARPPRPSESAWRRPTNGPPPPREDVPRGPREGGRGRGGRGRGEGRGGRGGYQNERQYSNDGRMQRQNTNPRNAEAAPASATQSPAVEKTETAALEEDGWSTVSKPKKNITRGGSRAIAS